MEVRLKECFYSCIINYFSKAPLTHVVPQNLCNILFMSRFKFGIANSLINDELNYDYLLKL